MLHVFSLVNKTEPGAEARNAKTSGAGERALLCLILLAATALRLHGIGFGLPALNDPDEPLFLMTALDMLRHHTLNPHWFGHPGTITLYTLALTMAGTGAVYLALGKAAGLAGLAAAAYADPGIVLLPARVMIAACGVACVWLTWRLGRKLGGPAVGLIGAALLAANAIHVELSQIVRTDVQASVFMLLGALASVDVLREGRRRDHVLAGVFAGLACATKWPAALILIGPLCAAAYRMRGDRFRVGPLALLALSALAALLIASPFLVFDYRTVMTDLTAEARPYHPGGTGGGFVANVGWYIGHPLLSSFGLAGLLLAAIGLAWRVRRDPAWSVAVLPGVIVFFLLLADQSLRWERWVVPLLPFLSIAAGRALCGLAQVAADRFDRRAHWLAAAVLAVVLLPMLAVTHAKAVERAHDTRQVASAWIRAHVPPGSSVLVEDAAFDLLNGPWSVRFPLGTAGCVDARTLLGGRVSSAKVQHLRGSAPSVDFGHVAQAHFASCRTDYAVFSHLALYQQDPGHYPEVLARYQQWLAKARVVAVLRPVPGKRGGPTIYIAAAMH